MEWVGDARLAAGPEATWYLEAAFTPGAHLGTVCDDPMTPVVVTGIEELTTIRVPSGRLVVDAPFHDDQVCEYQRGLPTRPPRELAVRIPSGVYRVEIAWTAGPYEFMGEHVDGVECAATRLCISDDPVVGWEMGLSVEDDMPGFSRARSPASSLMPMSAALPTQARGRPCAHRFARSWTGSLPRAIPSSWLTGSPSSPALAA
ncbi:hypothetical protein ACH4LT_26670 [Streptomyces clavifer]|uniref:hypothetical protein n=1 Tax=Streptomyces clavifer TaxID=68188 RepID=UPI00378D4034